MSELYDRIEQLCKRKGINVSEMCRVASVTRGNLSDLKMGRTSSLSAKNLRKVANYFNVSVGYLLGEEEKPAQDDINLDELEFALFGEVRELDDADKEELLRDARRFNELRKLKKLQQESKEQEK